jgi:ABC-type methionine transport system ATPase subunit
VFGHPRADLTRQLLRTVRPPLPESLVEALHPVPVAGDRCLLRVDGSGAEPYAAVLALLAGDSAWQTDIVHAEVDRIAGHPVGTVTFSVRYRDDPLRGLLENATRRCIDVRVVGYVGG